MLEQSLEFCGSFVTLFFGDKSVLVVAWAVQEFDSVLDVLFDCHGVRVLLVEDAFSESVGGFNLEAESLGAVAELFEGSFDPGPVYEKSEDLAAAFLVDDYRVLDVGCCSCNPDLDEFSLLHGVRGVWG